jgi:hypothetical protein
MTAIEDREAGLRRELAPGQVTMIAIGGAIGTGLFLGSTLSIRPGSSRITTPLARCYRLILGISRPHREP